MGARCGTTGSGARTKGVRGGEKKAVFAPAVNHTGGKFCLPRASRFEARRSEFSMPINDLPVLSALRTKMQWHQERQRVLAENISNSDTPNFKPRDLVEPKFRPDGASAGGSMGTL